MNNEKMKILQMLESGKITSEEAARLLEATNNNEYTKTNYNQKPNDNSSSNSNNGKTQNKGVNVDDFVGELGRKFDALAKDWEPKLKKFSGVVMEKTSDMADKFSKNVGTYKSQGIKPLHQNEIEKSFEKLVSGGYNEISLSGFNGNVSVRGYNGDKITIKVFYKSIAPNASIELENFGSRYTLNYDQNDFKSVRFDAFIPESMFNIVAVDVANGAMDVSSIKTKFFKGDCLNMNGVFRDIVSENIKIENCNGKLGLYNLIAENAHIENSNGEITGNNLDIGGMKISTSNAGIIMNMNSFSQFSEYIWAFETNNAKIAFNLPVTSEIGYHLKCQTVLSSVKIGLIGLNYMINDGACAEAKSSNYDVTQRKVKIAVETSNAPIIIN